MDTGWWLFTTHLQLLFSMSSQFGLTLGEIRSRCMKALKSRDKRINHHHFAFPDLQLEGPDEVLTDAFNREYNGMYRLAYEVGKWIVTNIPLDLEYNTREENKEKKAKKAQDRYNSIHKECITEKERLESEITRMKKENATSHQVDMKNHQVTQETVDRLNRDFQTMRDAYLLSRATIDELTQKLVILDNLSERRQVEIYQFQKENIKLKEELQTMRSNNGRMNELWTGGPTPKDEQDRRRAEGLFSSMLERSNRASDPH